MKDNFQYDRRHVAFLDILGFSRLMDDSHVSEKYARNLHHVFSIILYETESIFFEGEHIEDEGVFEFEFSRPADSRCQITTVSDAIVISLPEYSTADSICPRGRLLQLLQLLECVADVQAFLAAFGVLCRGGLTVGPLYHGRDIVLGQGLVSAYRLESKKAQYPRVVIDKSVVEILLNDALPTRVAGFRNRIAHLLREDNDGEVFIDYFGFRPISGGLIYQEETLKAVHTKVASLLASEKNARVQAKLEWTVSYIKRALGRYENPLGYIMDGRDSHFRERYPRTYENMMAMANNIVANNGEYKEPFE